LQKFNQRNTYDVLTLQKKSVKMC